MNASKDGCLFRALGPDGKFLMRRRSSNDMSLWLREALIQYGGYSARDVLEIRSHSLKDTQLSWCAKAGVKHGTRRLLGGHAKVNDLTMLEYSRDAMTTPPEELRIVLEAVASGAFDPDATRSGRWKNGHTLESYRRRGVSQQEQVDPFKNVEEHGMDGAQTPVEQSDDEYPSCVFEEVEGSAQDDVYWLPYRPHIIKNS